MKIIAVLIIGGVLVSLVREILHVKIDAHPIAYILFIVCVELYGIAIWWSVK
jgi:hypothetical protein